MAEVVRMGINTDVVALLTDLDVTRSDPVGPGARPQFLWHQDGREFSAAERVHIRQVERDDLLAAARYCGALADFARTRAAAAAELAELLASIWASHPEATARAAFSLLRGPSRAAALDLLTCHFPGVLEELRPELFPEDMGPVPPMGG
jgi:hypothetical protein